VPGLREVRCEGRFDTLEQTLQFLERLPPQLTSLTLTKHILSDVSPTAFNHLTALCSLDLLGTWGLPDTTLDGSWQAAALQTSSPH